MIGNTHHIEQPDPRPFTPADAAVFLRLLAQMTPHPTEQNDTDLLDTDEVAKILRLKKNTLEIWRFQGKGPRFLKLGRAVRYRRADVTRYQEGSLCRSTADYTVAEA